MGQTVILRIKTKYKSDAVMKLHCTVAMTNRSTL